MRVNRALASLGVGRGQEGLSPMGRFQLSPASKRGEGGEGRWPAGVPTEGSWQV